MIAMSIFAGGSYVVAPQAHANQVDSVVSKPICEQTSGTLAGCADESKKLDENGGYFTDIMNVIFYLGGIIAVIFLIVGGIQYITATGDSSRIAKGKNTIIYSIAGLIVLILARAIAGFIVSRIQ